VYVKEKKEKTSQVLH